MSNADRELEFLKKLKNDRILDLGRFQLVKGSLLIEDTKNRFKYDKVIEYCNYETSKEDFIDNMIYSDNYYLLQLYSVHVEKNKGVLSFDSASKAVKVGISWIDGFEKVFEKWMDKDVSTKNAEKENLAMTRESLKERIEKLVELVKNGESSGIDIQGKKFTYAIRCFYLAEEFVITFGGYALHYEIYGLDIYETDEIIDKFEDYISSYEGDSLENCTECPIVNQNTLMC